jgi:hypothetical protein
MLRFRHLVRVPFYDFVRGLMGRSGWFVYDDDDGVLPQRSRDYQDKEYSSVELAVFKVFYILIQYPVDFHMIYMHPFLYILFIYTYSIDHIIRLTVYFYERTL